MPKKKKKKRLLRYKNFPPKPFKRPMTPHEPLPRPSSESSEITFSVSKTDLFNFI